MTKFTKAVAAIMLTVSVILVAGCNKPDELNNGGNSGNDVHNDTLEDYEFVDLGLPSGTLWATCNVGATDSEDFGDYFAWGETLPKDIYDWKSYKYGNLANECFELIKYCTDSCCGLNGFVDGLTVLEPIDDAARANWGADWRMPTKEEWEELYRITTCNWTTQNGVEGRLLTGVNGNSIFLPATGFRLDGELIGSGLGIYWSSTLHTDFTVRGWSFHFDSVNSHVCGTYERCRGHVVRAVRSAR